MTVDPQTNLNNYIEQWNQANTQYNNDYGYLATMLAQMIALAKEGGNGIQEAFQVAEMTVMPSAMQVQGDTMGQLASGMNIGSALQEFTTDTQNDINGGASMTPAQAQQFVQYLQEFYNDVNTTPPPAWLSASTQANLVQSITQMCQAFGVSNPSQLSASTVQSDIQNWSKNPTNTSTNGKTGQQNLQDLQSGFTQWNNTESAQSQGLQAQEQFASNTFNQYLNACTDIFQSTQQQAQSMVQNQKSQ